MGPFPVQIETSECDKDTCLYALVMWRDSIRSCGAPASTATSPAPISKTRFAAAMTAKCHAAVPKRPEPSSFWRCKASWTFQPASLWDFLSLPFFFILLFLLVFLASSMRSSASSLISKTLWGSAKYCTTRCAMVLTFSWSWRGKRKKQAEFHEILVDW